MALRRIRPTNILPAAGLAAVAFGLATWAADPAWARSAGLDVWNVGRLEDELRKSRAEYLDLEARHVAMREQFEANDQLVRDVYAGRRRLADAAAVLWETNQDMPGFVAVVTAYFRGPTDTAKSAHNILNRIEIDTDLPAGEKARALARLRSEYAAAFGAPAPTLWP